MEKLIYSKVHPKLKNFFSNYDLKLCLACGTCAGGCPITGMPEMQNNTVMKVLRMLSFGWVEEVAASDFPWMCTGCGRCSYACPMNIDIPSIMATMKQLRIHDQVPWQKTGNEEGVSSSSGNLPGSNEAYISYLEDFGLELAEAECPGFPMGTTAVYTYLMKLIKSGSIKLNRSVHKNRVFTFHDACKHGRVMQLFFGKGYYEEPRWILEQCVDHFVEMHPNRGNSHCCGAGGALWASNFEKQSAYLGRLKVESIRYSKADVVVVGCSKCYYQLKKRLPRYYDDYPFDVQTIWDVVVETIRM
jgi:Fe-S oxidoreductase